MNPWHLPLQHQACQGEPSLQCKLSELSAHLHRRRVQLEEFRISSEGVQAQIKPRCRDLKDT